MGKQQKTNNARAIADSALATWRAADEAHKASSDRFQATRAAAEKARGSFSRLSPERDLEIISSEVAALEAEDAARAATAAATVAVDAAEREEGDALAIACDLAKLHDDVVALARDEDRLREELADAVKRRLAHVTAARAAHDELARRRSSAGLPGPQQIPDPAPPLGGGRLELLLVDALKRLVTEGAPIKSNGEQISRLRRREVEVRAGIELARREEEERQRERDEYDRRKEEDRKAEAKRQTEQHKALQAKYDAEQKRIADLADAQKARAGA